MAVIRKADVDAELRKRWRLADDDPMPVSLPKMLLSRGQARALVAERNAADDNRFAGTSNSAMGSDLARSAVRPAGVELAQAVIPIPRLFPVLPPLFYGGDRGGSPPRGPGPQRRRKPKKQCEAEYSRNVAACEEAYPRVSFPGSDFLGEGRRNCGREATRVYSDCLTGRISKPFDPRLFYEEDE